MLCETRGGRRSFLITSILFVSYLFLYLYLYFTFFNISAKTNDGNHYNIKDNKSVYSNSIISISFDFLVNDFVGDWDNLFQTSAGNSGIRMEISRDRKTAGLVLGSKDSYVVLPSDKIPTFKVWHKLDILIDRNAVIWKIDGKLYGAKEYDSLNIKLDDIFLGAGLSRTRPFNGEINNFSLIITENVDQLYIMTSFLIFLLIFNLCFWLFFVEKNSFELKLIKYLKESRFQIALYILVVAFFLGVKACFVYYTFAGILSDIFFILAVIEVIRLIVTFAHRYKNAFAAVASFVFVVGLFPLIITAGYCIKNKVTHVNLDTFNAILQTNISEAYEFLISYFNIFEMISVFFALIVFSCVVFMLFRLSHSSLKLSNIKFALLFLLLSFSLHLRAYEQNFSTVLLDFYDYVQEANNNLKKLNSVRLNIMSQIKASKEAQGELYVLVIGESVNKDHMGVYGYFRNTTPFLNNIISNPNWIKFENAYSNYSHTVPALMRSLTKANQYNKENYYTSPSIIGVLNKANFNTYWISSHSKFSFTDNPLTAIANLCKKAIFINTFSNGEAFSTDANIVPAFEDLIPELDLTKNNFIVIHLIGSHAHYKKRYPSSFASNFPSGLEYFGDLGLNIDLIKNHVDFYDNSIKYTDFILSELFNRVQKLPVKVKSLVYFSDHGEDVFDKKYHDSSLFNFNMVRIPFLIWLSDDYINQNKIKFNSLRMNTKKIFTSGSIFESLIGLTNLDTSLADAQLDISSQKYSVNEDRVTVMFTGDNLNAKYYTPTSPVKVIEDPVFLLKRNLDKINNIFPDPKFIAINIDPIAKAYDDSSKGFLGAEINIDSDPNLSIGHSTPSYKYRQTDSGVEGYDGERKGYVGNTNLELFLELSVSNSFRKIWVDLKNFELQNKFQKRALLSKLNALNKKYKFKEKVIIETWAQDQMELFYQSGWKTSYYLHEKNWPEIQSKDPAELAAVAKKIAKVILYNKFSSCSFFAHHYDFVKNYLEPILPQDVDFHTWSVPLPKVSSKEFLQVALKNPIVSDKRIKTIMLDSESKFSITGF